MGIKWEAGEMGKAKCEAEQERADWAARSHATHYTPGDVFRNGTAWESRPGSSARGGKERSRTRDQEGGEVGEWHIVTKRSRS